MNDDFFEYMKKQGFSEEQIQLYECMFKQEVKAFWIGFLTFAIVVIAIFLIATAS